MGRSIARRSGKVMGDQAALDALNQTSSAVRRRRDELLRAATEGGDLLSSTTSPPLEALDPAQFDVVVLVDASTPAAHPAAHHARLSNDEATHDRGADARRAQARRALRDRERSSLKQLERKAAPRSTTAPRARWRGGWDRRVLLLAAADAPRAPTLNPIAARYADAGSPSAGGRDEAAIAKRGPIRAPTPSSRLAGRRTRSTHGGAAVPACSRPSPMTPIRSPCASTCALGRRRILLSSPARGTTATPRPVPSANPLADKGSAPITFARPSARGAHPHGEYPGRSALTKDTST